MKVLTTLLLAFVIAASSALGQVSTGTIVVQVEDSSGSAVVGAAVTLTHVATGQLRNGATNEIGQFRATFLPIGEYTISATSPGFKTTTINGLTLAVDQNSTVTAVLVPGEVHESVQVTGVAPLLETSTSSIGQVINTRQILEMPLNGRQTFALGLLSGNTTALVGVSSNLPFVAGGGRYTSNEVMIDGVDDNMTTGGGVIGRSGIAYQPSVDAVQEYKVQSNNFSAEFGQSSGFVMNATIKAGTNDYHGTVFEFLRNDKLDANNFFSNLTGTRKGEYRQNQFGGSVGGHIVRNRTFFFGDYEGTRRRLQSGSSLADLPPTAFRSGDFSSYTQPIYDVTSRHIGPAGAVISNPYSHNQIPSSQINPAAAAILGLVPAPNFGPPNATSRNFFVALPQPYQADRGDVRIDQIISSKNNLFGRFSIQNADTPSAGRFGAGQWIGGGSDALDNGRQAVLSDVHIFSPSVVNEARFGYTRYNSSILGTGPAGLSFAQSHNLAIFPFPGRGFPAISFPYNGIAQGAAEFTGFGGSTSTLSIENRFQWADNVNITRGQHTLKMGTDLRRLREETLTGDYGTFYFGSIFTSSSDKPGSGAPLADFLLGYPAAIEGSQMLDWGREREIYSGTYFQDDWKVTRNLTFNLGIRYDLYTQPVDAKDRGALFNVATGVFVIPGQNGFSRAIVDGDHNNFAPRTGFAYQATSKLVIRGGYGIFYGFRERNQQTTAFSNNVPNTPVFAVPPVTANGTVTPPYSINTPILPLPSDPTLSAFSAANPYAQTFRATAFHNAQMPMIEQANLSVEYAPTPSWLIAMTLSGEHGRDLTSGVFMKNSIPFQQALAGLTAQAHRPFPDINGAIYYSGSFGSNNYDAINFRIEKRYSAGLSFLLNYTISKNIENEGFLTNFNQYSTVIMLDSYNPKREKALSPVDVPQVFVLSYNYELPWGPGRKFLNTGLASKILGGWNVAGITSLRGGYPAEVRVAVAPPVYGSFNLPDRVSGVPEYLGNGPDGYINPAAFRVPGTVLNQAGTPIEMFGNSGRGMVRGPGSVNFDFSVLKDFTVTEHSRLQFRSEFFNLTNTPTFTLPSPSASAMTCTGTPGGPCTNASFGTMQSGSATGRQIQFGLKYLF